MADDSLQYFAEDDTLEDPIDISLNTTNQNINNSTINDIQQSNGLAENILRDNMTNFQSPVLSDSITNPKPHSAVVLNEAQKLNNHSDLKAADENGQKNSEAAASLNYQSGENGGPKNFSTQDSVDENELNIVKKIDRPNFIVGADVSDISHSTNVRKLTDTLNFNNNEVINTLSEGAPKLKNQFRFKRASSPTSNQQAVESRSLTNNLKLCQPFPIQRGASDIYTDDFRVPPVVSFSKLNNSMHTSTPTISHSVSKDDIISSNNENLSVKKSLHNISNNNGTDDSMGETASINLKIKKNQGSVKLPSESQIINTSIQTPRPKTVPSKNKTDYFAAKLADATNEKISKEDDQEENFVYEDLMLEQDKLQSKKMITKSQHQGEEKDEGKNKTGQNSDAIVSKQSSKLGILDMQQNSIANTTSSSAINNISQGSANVPLGKNLTNKSSVIIDPSRLMISNQKSLNSISPNNIPEIVKTSDKSNLKDTSNSNKTFSSLEGPVVFKKQVAQNNMEEVTNNLKFLNPDNTPSNFSSLSNRPSNLMNNRNNLTAAISHNINNTHKSELENNLESGHSVVAARPSLVTLSTNSSNNNLSQYKKMMQNNPRHSSVTVGILPIRQQNKSIILQQEKSEQPVVSPTLSQNFGGNNGSKANDFYNDMLDYSSPNKKMGSKPFRDKSNRSSIIECIQEDHGDFTIPAASSFVFESGKPDQFKKSTIHDTLEETELNTKFSHSNIPELPFDSNKIKQSKQNSKVGSPTEPNIYNNRPKRKSIVKQGDKQYTDSSIKRFISKGTDDFINRDPDDKGTFSSNFNNHLNNIMSETHSEWEKRSIKNNKADLAKSTISESTLDANLADKLKVSIRNNDLLKSPLPKSFLNYDNTSSHHHFGLDDDYDEDDFDERSSFYYRPRKNSQSNIGKTSTAASGNNIPKNFKHQNKVNSARGLKHSHSKDDDRMSYDNSINGLRLYDETSRDTWRNHFSDTDTNPNNEHAGALNLNNIEENVTRDTGSNYHKRNGNPNRNSKIEANLKNSQNYIWGDSEISFDDENEYPPLASENNRNIYYYDSIHDFSPVKNNSGRKNGNKVNLIPHIGNHYYSPHDYYGGNGFYLNSNYGRKTMWSKIKHFVCWLFLTTCLIMLGIGIGAFIVSNKELEEFNISSISNSIVTQDEILFDITAFAHNPSLFSITVQSVNIDIFAESNYFETDGKSSIYQKGDKEEAITILLGSVFELETPLIFNSDIFWRYFSVSKSSVKLRNPAKSTDQFIDSNFKNLGLVKNNQLDLANTTTSDRLIITLEPSTFLSLTSKKTERSTTSTLSKSKPTKTGNADSTTTLSITHSSASAKPTSTPPSSPPKEDKKFAQWKEISKYEFTLIIKGAAYYQIPFFKTQRSVPVQHQVVVNKGKHK